MEICIDSVESALNAARGGASRLELCSSLSEGGLTPSPGLVKMVTSNVSIPCFAMIRPRAGDFVYSELELEMMMYDIDVLLESGAQGLVLGCLDPQGEIDVIAVKRLMKVARTKKSNVEFTFHRAIDMSKDLTKSCKVIAGLGFSRILTSGGHATALEGASVISELRKEAVGCSLMPGGGISEENMQRVMEKTRCIEFHASARVQKPSVMEWKNNKCFMGNPGAEEFMTMVTSISRVEALVRIYKDNILITQK